MTEQQAPSPDAVEEEVPHLLGLPNELLTRILLHSAPAELAQVQFASWTLHRLVNTADFWGCWEDAVLAGRGAASGLETEAALELCRNYVAPFASRLAIAYKSAKPALPPLRANQLAVVIMRTSGHGLQPFVEGEAFGFAIATFGHRCVSFSEKGEEGELRRSVMHVDGASYLSAVLGDAEQVWLRGARLVLPEGDPPLPQVLLQAAPGSTGLLDKLRELNLLERSRQLFLVTEAGTSYEPPRATGRPGGLIFDRNRLTTLFSLAVERTWREEQHLPWQCASFPLHGCSAWQEGQSMMVGTAPGTPQKITCQNLPTAVLQGDVLLRLKTPRGQRSGILALGVGDRICFALEPFVTLPWSAGTAHMATGEAPFAASPRPGYALTVRRSRELAQFVPPSASSS